MKTQLLNSTLFTKNNTELQNINCDTLKIKVDNNKNYDIRFDDISYNQANINQFIADKILPKIDNRVILNEGKYTSIEFDCIGTSLELDRTQVSKISISGQIKKLSINHAKIFEINIRDAVLQDFYILPLSFENNTDHEISKISISKEIYIKNLSIEEYNFGSLIINEDYYISNIKIENLLISQSKGSVYVYGRRTNEKEEDYIIYPDRYSIVQIDNIKFHNLNLDKNHYVNLYNISTKEIEFSHTYIKEHFV